MRRVSPIAIVTCRVLPEPDPDEQLLLEECNSAGVAVELVAWDDESVDWAAFRAAILRSTWNYYEDPERFSQWVRNVSALTQLKNHAALVLWNLDKRYLLELESRGIRIVPTKIITGPEVFDSIGKLGWSDFVIKPTISAGSYLTKRFQSCQMQPATNHAREILTSSEVIVQPYVPSVAHGGEVSLIHIDGEFTHAIIKNPRFADDEESVSKAIEATTSQKAFALAVLGELEASWLYARVDVMADSDGEWMLSELELIEPSLFFLQCPAALSRMINAMSRL